MKRKVMIILTICMAFVSFFSIEHGIYISAQKKTKEHPKQVEILSSSFLYSVFPFLNPNQNGYEGFDGIYELVFPFLGVEDCFIVEEKQKEGVLTETEVETETFAFSDEMESILTACDLENEKELEAKMLAEMENRGENPEQAASANDVVVDNPVEVSEESCEEKYIDVGGEIRMSLKIEDYEDNEQLINRFYTVDPTTSARFLKQQILEYYKKDMTLKGDLEKPKILIYHTHSQEGFADSVLGDPSTTIVGAGEQLKEILKKQYGITVIHETGEYDLNSRSKAYANVMPMIEDYLAKYPSIEVLIDLHRDEVKEGKLLQMVSGKPTARFMFFNGMSYLNEIGPIDYLYNPNLQDNLAFSFRLQFQAEQLYPGLARKIYLKGYRYNLHYLPKSLLIELGAQTNTREEISNALPPLAEVLSRVLLGEEEQQLLDRD